MTSYICNKCKILKPETDFGKYKAKKNGLNSWCKQCTCEATSNYRKRHPEKAIEWNAKNPEKIKEMSKKYREATVDLRKHKRLQKCYGLSVDQYNELLASQNGVCAICHNANTDGRPLYVDHNHSTNQVRGLLCVKCNFALGYAKEDITILQTLIDYLKKYN